MPRVADRVLAPQSDDDFLPRFRASIDPEWIEEALVATGTATIRRRRLPAEQVIWLVLGMGIMRDQPLTEIVAAMDLALPGKRGVRVAPSTIVQARERLGDDPLHDPVRRGVRHLHARHRHRPDRHLLRRRRDRCLLGR